MQCPRHLHSKGYKGTGLSQGLNSCRTSNPYSFYYRVWKVLRLFYSKSIHLFIGTNPFYFPLQLEKCFKDCPPGRLGRRRKCHARSASFPFPAIQKYASHRPSHTDKLFKTSPNNISCTGSTQSECALIKTRKLLLVGMWRSSVEDSS